MSERERSWSRGGQIFKQETGSEEAAPWVRRADRADAVAARSDGGLDLAPAWASMRIKLDTCLLHVPPMPRPQNDIAG